MSVFKKVNQSKSKFQKGGFDESIVKDLQTQNEEHYNALSGYYDKINSGGYLSADDLSAYDTALKGYVATGNKLRNINKSYGKGYTAEEDKKWTDSLTAMQSDFDNASKYYGAFKTEQEYGDYLKGIEQNKDFDKYNFDEGALKIKDWKNIYASAKDIQTDIIERMNFLADGNAGTGITGYEDRYITEWKNNAIGGESLEEYIKRTINDRKNAITESISSTGYSTLYDLESGIGEKERYHKLAERYHEGKALRDNALNAEDFDLYNDYNSGVGGGVSMYTYINEPSKRQQINAQLTGYGDPITGAMTTYDSMQRGNNFNTTSKYQDMNLDYMSEDEIEIYNYYYNTQGSAKAQEYINSIQETLNQRAAIGIVENIGDNGFLQMAFAFGAGVEQFGTGIENLFSNEDYYAPSAMQIAGGQIRENLGDSDFKIFGNTIGQIGYDIFNTTGNMLPSILLSYVPVVGGVLGTASMGLSAAGNAKAEMINLGYSKEQATAYGVLVGASEAGLQYLLGGISKLGGKASGKIGQALVGKVDNAFARVSIKHGKNIYNALVNHAVKLGVNMASEGLEESIQTILEPWFKSIVTGEQYNAPNIDEVLYSGLLGALSAGVLEGIGTTAETVKYTSAGKAIQNAGAIDRLAKTGSLFSADSVAYQIAGRVNENTGAYTLGRLLYEVDATLTEQNKAEIAEALIQKGMTDKDAKTHAEWLSYVAEGAEMTDEQIEIIESNEVVSKVFYDVIVQRNTTEYQRMQAFAEKGKTAKVQGALQSTIKEGKNSKVAERTKGYKDIAVDILMEKMGISKATEASTTDGLTEEEIEIKAKIASEEAFNSTPYRTQNKFESKYTKKSETSEKTANKAEFSYSADGKTIYKDKEVSVKGIDSIKNGVVSVRLDNGEVVDAKDVSFSSKDEAIMYEMVADLGVNGKTSTKIIELRGDTEPMLYAIEAPMAYKYGKIGYTKGLGNLTNLSYEQKTALFGLGQTDAKADAEARTEASKQSVAKSAPYEFKGEKIKKNGIEYLGVNPNELKGDLQKANVFGAEFLAKVSRLEIALYASEVKNGKRVVTINGKDIPAPNGMFREGNKIYLDVNAGRKGEGTMLFTLSHEVGHYIRQWNAKAFKELGDLLFENYEGEISVEGLIDDEIEALKARRKAEKKKMPTEAELFDMAYEEVVCNALSKIFADETTFVKLAKKVKAKNKSLWAKIGEAIKAFLKKLKDVIGIYSKYDLSIRNGAMTMNMATDVYNKLQDMYIKAFVEADENYQTIGERNLSDFVEAKNTDGDTLFQYRAMEADKDIYRAMLLKHGLMSNAEIGNLFTMIDKALDVIKNNLEALDYAWDVDIDDRAFMPVKPNSDTLYKVSLDFSTLCRKRLLQQTIQATLQEALNKPLSKEEGIAIRDELMKIQEEGRKIEIACALCYVESARMKSPQQIKKFLNNRVSVLIDFFAGRAGGATKEKIETAEADARAKLAKENPNGINGKNGAIVDPLTVKLNKMAKPYADQIRDAKKAAKLAYQPTANEQKMIDAVKGMKASDFTSPEGLENLAKNYSDIFDAYTSYVRNATHSKGIEKDTWWRAGDSDALIGQALIDKMNAENGLRSQSWSDFQVIHLLDYIAATIELSSKNAKRQSYTKVPDYVLLLGNTGDMINMSLIPMAKYNGKLEYDSVEGIDYKTSLELRNKYHATAGTICIGIDNAQIKQLLADGTIDYVIPYHKSSMSQATKQLMHIPSWFDYEAYQSEDKLSSADAKANAKKYGVELLGKDDKKYNKSPNFSEWFDIQEARQIAKMENANPSDPAMQKKYGVMYGAYKAMQNAANNYLKLCAERGLAPKFSHEKADFTAEANYWKLLIDRKMVDNVTGEIIEQQAIKPIFNEADVLGILNRELERYPQVKKDQEYATRKVVGKFLSGEMKIDKDTREAIKKTVDNVTAVNIEAASEDIMYSDRGNTWRDVDKIQGLEDYSVEEVADIVRAHIENIAMEYGEEIEIVDIRPFGSRARGTAKNASDLDVVVQYEGDIREDDMFNMLNDEADKLSIDGIEVDINPIKADDTGTIEEYLDRVYGYDKYNETKYSTRDSAGNTLSAEQQEYFKDSKVRDSKGRLQVVYHGTTSEFNTFKRGDIGYHFGSYAQARNRLSYQGGKKRYIKAYLDIKNPLVVDHDSGSWHGNYLAGMLLAWGDFNNNSKAVERLQGIARMYDTRKSDVEMKNFLKSLGYDGVQYLNTHESDFGKESYSYIAFDSNQVKEVTNFAPTEDPDIRYSLREAETSAKDFVTHMKNLVKTEGKWYSRDVYEYVEAHPELNFIDRIYEKDKQVKKDITNFLDNINDVVLLDDLSWFMGGAYSSKGFANTFTYPYRGAVRTFKNAVNKRINALMTEKVNGTNLGVTNGEYSLREVKDFFEKLNGNVEIGKLAEKVFATAKHLGVNIRFTNKTFASNAVGDALGDMIEYKTSYFNDTAVSDQKKASTILHELIHACTVYVMDAHQGTRDYRSDWKSDEYLRLANAAIRLNKIYEEIKGDADFAGQYGLKNAKEMVAELSNEDFVALLKKKNLWERIVDWICDLFGIRRGNSAYENAMLCLDYILDNPDYIEYTSFASNARALAEQAGLEGFGKIAYFKEDTMYSLREVAPIEPTSKDWKRTLTTAQVKAQFPDLWDVSADESEVRNPTQVKVTVGSYRKIYDFLKKTGFKGTILDASSGLGYGTKAGIEEYGFKVDDIEPYPDKSYTPKYTDYSKLHKQYDVIISNAVLNVIPQDQRDALVVKMGELLKVGGRMFVNVRGDDVKNASSKVAINEDLMEYYISNTGSYQKGFTKDELVAYLKDALGEGYTVMKTSFFGKTSAVVTKNEDQTMYSVRSDTEDTNRSLLADALESVVQNEAEAEMLSKYKATIGIMEENERMLAEMKEQLFSKGIDNETRKKLRFEINKIANNINTYDKQLYRLEANAHLKAVLEREKTKAYERAKQRGRDALKAYREQVSERFSNVIKSYQESRKKAVEGRHKTILRNQLKGVINDLRRVLEKGTKERNVKIGLQETVRKALELSEVLLSDEYTNEAIARLGVPSVTDAEQELLDKYNVLLDNIAPYKQRLEKLYEQRKKLKQEGAKQDEIDAVNAKIDGIRKDAEYGKISRAISELNADLASVFVRERNRYNKQTAQDIMQALYDAYTSLEDSNVSYIKEAYNNDLADRLKKLKDSLENVYVKDMSLENLQDIYEAFKMVKHVITDANTIFREGRKEDLGKRIEAVQAPLMSMQGNPNDIPKLVGEVKNFIRYFSWNNLRPVDAFERLGVEAFTELFWDAVYAQDTYARDVVEAEGVITEARKKYKYNKWDLKTAKSFKTTNGLTLKLTLADMMSIYAYSFRDQAYDHMTKGGFVFDDGTYKETKNGVTKVRVKTTQTYIVNDALIQDVIASLTKEQKAYVEEIQAYLSAIGAKGNEVSRILYGIDIFGEKHYFPLQSSSDYRSSVEQALNQTQTMVSLKNTGMTKATIPHANNPIVLRGFDDVVLEHIDKMSKYHAYVIPIENIQKVFNNSGWTNGNPVSTKALIAGVFGEEAKNYFEQYITDLNGGGTAGSGAKSPWFNLVGRAKGVAVGANLSVMAQQYFSIVRAMSEVDAKYFVPYLNRQASKADGSIYEELKRYAPVAIIKEMGGFDIGSNRGVSNYIGNKNAPVDGKAVYDKVQDVAMFGAALMDKLGWTTIWRAVKKEIASTRKDLKIGTPEFLDACGKRFTEVVTKTQVYDSVNSRSGFMRSKSELTKFATAFMGEPTVIVGMWFTSINNLVRAYKTKDKAKIKKAWVKVGGTASSIVISGSLGAVAKAVVQAMREDDEDEAYLEKLLERFSSNLANDINPLNYLPYFKDIVSIVEGWNVDRPDMDLIADLVSSGKKLFDGEATFEDILGAIGSIGNFFGIPLKNLIRDTKAIINTILSARNSEKMTAGGLRIAFKEGFFGKELSNGQQLYEAYMRGDKEQIKRIEGRYDKKSEAESALRQALRKNDDRISKAAQAVLNGDHAERIRLTREIVAEGHFRQDTVVSAINAEITYLRSKNK